MRTRSAILAILAIAGLLQTRVLNVSHAQALNPPYLSEMPSVDRVMHAMQTADPRETALRQLGAFYQLMEIIKALSGPREFRGFTPDEARIMQAYNLAQYNLAQAADKAYPGPAGTLTKLSEENPYHYGRWDRRFGVEGIAIFKTFFSPALYAEFQKIVQGDNARHQARIESYRQDARPPQQTAGVPLPQQTAEVKPGSTAEMRRCIESGRSQRNCFSEGLTNGMDQITGIKTNETTSGMRMTGDYSGPPEGFGLFSNRSVATTAKLDANGGFTFPNARTGTYYIFGQTLDSRLPLSGICESI